MDRRDFMKAATTLLATAALQQTDFAQASGAEKRARMVLPMNRGWRYSPSFVEGGHDLNFDDSKFARVVVPHTNVALPWHGFDDKTYEFVSLYRRRFKLPPEARGQRVFIEGNGGNWLCGSLWYQYATDAISSVSGRYRPLGHQPRAWMETWRSRLKQIGSIICQR